MSDPAAAPASVEEALRLGYRPVKDPERYRAEMRAAKGLAVGAADGGCGKVGAVCYEKTHANGKKVVGYCDANGICQIYEK